MMARVKNAIIHNLSSDDSEIETAAITTDKSSTYTEKLAIVTPHRERHTAPSKLKTIFSRKGAHDVTLIQKS